MDFTWTESRMFDRINEAEGTTIWWVHTSGYDTRTLNRLEKKGIVEAVGKGRRKRWVLAVESAK